jgi:RimJ/RimL family protein N-acetyltransferase
MSLVFQTERLRIRKWDPEKDAAANLRIYEDEEVMRFLRGAGPIEPRTLETQRVLLERTTKRDEATPGLGYWAMERIDDGEVIGALLLKSLDDTEEIEVGYHLRRDAWGNGYATEAARGGVLHGFEVVGLDRIVAVVYPENVASQRVIAKLGFQRGVPGTWYGVSLDYWYADALPVECMPS